MDLTKILKNIFVLSLSHRVDRRLMIEKNFKLHQLHFQFFDALCYADVTEKSVLSKQEYAKKSTHKSVLRQAQMNNFDSVMIFEDDIEFDNDFAQKLKSYAIDVPQDCELLCFGGKHKSELLMITPNVYKVNDTECSHAIWLKSSSFSLILDIFDSYPNLTVAECYSLAQKKLNTYTFYSDLAWQSYGYSDVQEKFTNLTYRSNKSEKPIVHAYLLCYNEEYILPHIIKHYSSFCDKITFLNNESVDNSVDIILSHPNTEVITFSTDNQYTDDVLTPLKNEFWKKSTGLADYVVVGDADEFFYHPNMVEFLQHAKRQNITAFLPEGYWLIAEEDAVLSPDDVFFDKVNKGIKNSTNDKVMMFNPNEIHEINYEFGCHICRPVGNVRLSKYDCKMFHCRMLGLQDYIRKVEARRSRFSEFNRVNKLADYYLMSDEDHIKDYRNYLEKSTYISF